ncbi:phytoene desaturase family protein [Paenibacillus sp. FSL H7-0716]|uniref:4,4'-diaponeurosporene oxygenase n=1 Tax=Paenibacillus odorifer TaxID=189426 RepID=A0AB36J8R3_9BACL|nr:phytoene desaturase family protein [Paenibacillus odorifer]OME13564.1 phytoene dehydrogenase [Paenibacillus odorifer]OME16931.1 phytoene dehydrogenase [Paenibacillus odorifer]
MKSKAVIIGAGFGGLSCAVALASKGWEVTVLERQQNPGGKLQRIEIDGYTFDRGPSTITMPHVFRSLYELAGASMEDYVQMYELEPRTRNIFADGTVVDFSRDQAFMKDQIAKYSSSDALRYDDFMAEAAILYQLSEKQFLNKLLLSWRDKLSLPLLRDLLRVRPFLSLHSLLMRYFSHPHTLAMLGRYATYVGSSPFRSPAIFAMLGYVESVEGVYGVRGGTYKLVEGLSELAQGLGVRIMTGVEVTNISVVEGVVEGVDTTRGFYKAKTVIAGGDVLTVNRMLVQENSRPSMSDRKIAAYEPSLSGFVTLAGVPRKYNALLHHTVFFPEQYELEFRDIFERKCPPEHPTVYVCHSGYSESGMAPEGSSNLFILANAPYINEVCDWRTETASYGKRVLSVLASHGITGLHQSDVLQHYTPQNIADDTLAHKGAIYGISSNSVGQTFFRPGNRSSDVKGLWYVGGTTHPGGGTPIVSLSGRLVGEHIARHV